MPHWNSDADYEFTNTLDRAGWAWEFMRRNPTYRADFVRAGEARKNLPRLGHLYRGEGYEHADRLARQLGAWWGQLGPIADPQSDAVPLFSLAGPVQPNGQEVEAFFEEGDESGLGPQLTDFATLVFDVRRPLPPQLRRAATLLRSRKERVTSIKPVRSSEAEWALYLRVLDAKEVGATTAEIIKTIIGYRVLDDTVASNYQAQDRVSDHYRRACELRENPLALIY